MALAANRLLVLHATGNEPACAIVLAACNHARDMYDVPHKLGGLKKPPPRPRLHSFSEEDEAVIYDATDEVFGDFLFAPSASIN